jgi:DNA-binding NarL/FixJ family response regulator
LVRIDVVVLAAHLADGRGESLLADIEGCLRQPSVIMTGALVSDLQPFALQFRPVTVPKPVSAPALLAIVETVVGGYAVPAMTRFVARFGLSRREGQATVLLARGLRAKEIASEMCCSEKTVYAHLFRVCKKVDCSDSHEVVCKLLAFTCHTLGHTPPDHAAFVDLSGAGRGR